ncbi:MAG: PAS domain-containing protein [Cyclobacteriaceae bacterium]|nr:PAS domain-containing protein [Cyclobacteriaceae bacterium]
MFKKIKLTVGRKIFGSLLLLIILFAINAVMISNTSKEIGTMVSFSTDVIRPSSEALNKFQSLISKSKMLITNWVYLPDNIEDKSELKLIHNTEYPKIRQQIIQLSSKWESDSLRALIISAIDEMDNILQIQNEDVMLALVTFDDYEDPITRFSVDDELESIIVPKTDALLKKIGLISKEYNNIRKAYDEDMAGSMESLSNITIVLTSFLILIALVIAYVLVKSMTVPINEVKDVIEKMSRGETDINENLKTDNDEIGEMRTSVLHLLKGLKETTAFAENIGKGNYKAEYSPLSKKDVLGNALLEMRDNLSKVSDQERIRGWVNEGLAQFADLLRKNNDEMDVFAENVLRNLVKYLGVNQGGLYLVENEDGGEEFLSLASCYAWDKERHGDQKFYKGEGLAGQVWQEGLSIYITDVPDTYIKITSGLGNANPKFVFISPIKVNDEIQGVIEVASFTEIEEYKRDFIEKLGESIAATIFNVRNSMKTKLLLEESQYLTEQMKSQEEEMRQNMEEIQATQEEMERSQKETAQIIGSINRSIINIELDSEGKIIYTNSIFLDIVGYDSNEVFGETFRMFFSGEKASERFKQFWKELREGNEAMGEFSVMSKKGTEKILKGGFIPNINPEKELTKVLFYGVDITNVKELVL